ncbi:hypothetical protein J7F02_26705 [Streptomyces sp. ISL-112]|uniref:hypothetical protein n=1 Tax=unclassified Streptomyces TaxID=2593676 RepID=UPI001BE51DE9|nr:MULTISPECIES: hypothetical protein [unclassified Streptomyces]MBT2429117.1 hypothetical protein [Streptomyces sp. ISL-112]MBT2464744.1 hypothetical protein [Streptomyces sp. ISL-63]
MKHRRDGARVVAVAATGVLLAGCGSSGAETGEDPDPKPSSSVRQAGGPSTSPDPEKPEETKEPGALPSAYEFTPDPARVPRTAADARRLTRDAALGEADWAAGMVRATPYESGGTWPVLADSCVWSRTALPAGVLDTFTRRLDIPAQDGKGRIQGAVTVTVHKTVGGADREIKDTAQESFRCPAQELGGGQRLSGLMSLQFDQKDVRNADASLFEAGRYTGPGSGGTQDYVWSKSRIGPVTTAVSVKGAKGYQNADLLRIAAEGGAKVLYRVELELK